VLDLQLGCRRRGALATRVRKRWRLRKPCVPAPPGRGRPLARGPITWGTTPEQVAARIRTCSSGPTAVGVAWARFGTPPPRQRSQRGANLDRDLHQPRRRGYERISGCSALLCRGPGNPWGGRIQPGCTQFLGEATGWNRSAEGRGAVRTSEAEGERPACAPGAPASGEGRSAQRVQAAAPLTALARGIGEGPRRQLAAGRTSGAAQGRLRPTFEARLFRVSGGGGWSASCSGMGAARRAAPSGQEADARRRLALVEGKSLEGGDERG